jgi:hypothetical protein
MTDQVIRKLLEEALNLSYIEERLVEIIGDNLDQEAIAQDIWDAWEDEITAKAAEVAAEEILPF